MRGSSSLGHEDAASALGPLAVILSNLTKFLEFAGIFPSQPFWAHSLTPQRIHMDLCTQDPHVRCYNGTPSNLHMVSHQPKKRAPHTRSFTEKTLGSHREVGMASVGEQTDPLVDESSRRSHHQQRAGI